MWLPISIPEVLTSSRHTTLTTTSVGRTRDLFDKVMDEGGELSVPLTETDIRELPAPWRARRIAIERMTAGQAAGRNSPAAPAQGHPGGHGPNGRVPDGDGRH